MKTEKTTDNANTHQKNSLEQVQQSQDTSLNSQKIKTKWNDSLKSAKKMWSKLTDDEIEESGGDENKMTNLVKDRYDISIYTARKQVKEFLKNCSPS